MITHGIKNRMGKPYAIMALIGILIIISLLVSLNLGVIRIPPAGVFRTLFGQGTGQEELVLFQFRLPRMVIALLAGAGLAVSGTILQSVTRNDLAEPGILGIHSGAGLAVVLFIFFVKGTSYTALGPAAIFAMPFAALAGACLAGVLVYVLAWKNGVTPIRMLLVAIGVNAAFLAVMLVFQLRMDPRDFMKAMIWLTGSIWAADWRYVLASAPWILILIPIAWYKSRHLNVLRLGDGVAVGLGTNVERERRLLLFLSVALAGVCVAVGGGIAFLGLITPHLARKMMGPKHQVLIPGAALLGALLLLVSDTVARNVLAPSELPVGIVVSLLGAPYFVYLLIKAK